MTAKATGASTDYSFSDLESYDTTNFSSPSFTITPTSGSLTGGSDGSSTTGNLYAYTIPQSGGYDLTGNLCS